MADLLLVWQLVGEWISTISSTAREFTNANLKIVGIYYCVFMVVDLLAAMVGFLMERREDWNLLWWLVLQRFGYRQIMYYVVLRSISTALRGPFVGWGKLERHGTVKASAPSDSVQRSARRRRHYRRLAIDPIMRGSRARAHWGPARRASSGIELDDAENVRARADGPAAHRCARRSEIVRRY